MSKESHKSFVAEYDDPNVEKVYTEGRHNSAMLKAKNAIEVVVKSHYAQAFSVAMVLGFTAYVSDAPIESRAAEVEESKQYLAIAPSTPIYSQINRVGPSIFTLKEDQNHLTLDLLDQFMSVAVSSGVEVLEVNERFIRSWSSDIAQSLEPGKISYVTSDTRSKEALFSAMVAVTPAEVYLWTAILKDGELIQLSLEDSETLLSEPVSFADDVNPMAHQGYFLSDLDDGGSFNNAIDVLSKIEVAASMTNSIPPSEDVGVKGVPFILKGLNETGELIGGENGEDGLNYRYIDINRIGKEGLLNLRTKKDYGQLKLINVNETAKLILGTVNHEEKASVFGGFAVKKGNTWDFEALDLSSLNMKSKTFTPEGYTVVEPRDRYSYFAQIWGNVNGMLDEEEENNENKNTKTK